MNSLSIYHIAQTNEKVEFCSNIWVIKDISNVFKVVASKFCDESKHMYKLGKKNSPPTSTKFHCNGAQ
jgi:hypothetical protein